MIIRGGENIYPAEIENILLKMKEIDDAHVIGVPDERVGEEVAAYIKGKVGNIDVTKFIMLVTDVGEGISYTVYDIRYIMEGSLLKGGTGVYQN